MKTKLWCLTSFILVSTSIGAYAEENKPTPIPSNSSIEELEKKAKDLEENIKKTPSPIPTPTSTPSAIWTPTPFETPVVTPTPKSSIEPSKKPIKTTTPIKKEVKETKKEDKKLNIKNSTKYFLHPGKLVVTEYVVKPHDELKKIALKYNKTTKELMKMNNLESPFLIIGQKLIVDKTINPASNFEGIIVNIPETKLYYFQNGKLLMSYGVAVGVPSSRWQTPTGDFKIEEKVKDPTWYVPISIQNEMKERGQTVIKEIPAGPGNPLGRWFMSLGGGLGIHSTTSPWSIGSAASHGCMRMKSENAEVLFKNVKKDLPVKIIYQPIKINLDEKNNIRMEVFNNIYYKNVDFEGLAKTILTDYEWDKKVNWDLVKKLIKMRNGASSIIGKIPEEKIAKKVENKVINIKPSVKPTIKPSLLPSTTVTPIPSSSASNMDEKKQ
ncbi:MAG: L,D-transpeptidase family protein [Candidatus Sericytochromatia bacterium]